MQTATALKMPMIWTATTISYPIFLRPQVLKQTETTMVRLIIFLISTAMAWTIHCKMHHCKLEIWITMVCLITLISTAIMTACSTMKSFSR